MWDSSFSPPQFETAMQHHTKEEEEKHRAQLSGRRGENELTSPKRGKEISFGNPPKNTNVIKSLGC